MSTTPAAAPVNSSSFRNIVSDYGLLGTVGLGALLLALVLAPVIGGYPPGATYGEDVSLNALRALVCLSAIFSPAARGEAACEPPCGRGGALSAGTNRALDRVLVWATAGLTAISLLVHSHFLTSPVLLYAMLPATLDWLCFALAFMLACQWAARDRRAALLIVGALTLGATIAAVDVARDYGQSAQQGMRDYRAQGAFFSPNFAGGLLALTLPALTAACLAARERIGALVVGVAASLAFGALVATGSRAGVGIGCLGLLVALILALVSYRKASGEDAPPLPLPRVAALLAAFAMMAFAFRGPLLSRGGGAGGGDEHSGAFRKLTWQGTLAMAKANPVLGTGPGTFAVLYPRYAIVEKTELAHSSYLQLAGEEGFPALITALAAIAVSLLGGASALFRKRTTNPTQRLLLCGLVGGLLAGALRSIFDSEWSILGNALPFWTTAGLIAGITKSSGTLVPAESAPRARRAAQMRLRRGRGGVIRAILGTIGTILSLLLLYSAQTRDGLVAQIRKTGAPPTTDVNVWPPDPTLLFYTGHLEDTARIEPSGRRLYQLANYYDQAQHDTDKAIRTLQEAVAADPNSLQTWRKLAETQEAHGDHASAIASWQELVHRYEGPAGQVRAIPELTETHPAFAYAALADDAAAKGDSTRAASLYEKAADIVDAYSNTSPLYQQMEMASATVTNSDIEGKRQEVRDLYQRIIAAWTKVQPERAAELSERKNNTLARLDKFIKSGSLPAGTG